MQMSPSANRKQEQLTTRGPEPVIPPEIAALFEQPPLLPGEDSETYNRLLTGVAVSVAPTDVIEWLWVKDVIDLTWEMQRLRRLRAALLIGARREALDNVLNAHGEPNEVLVDLG